MRLEKFTGFVLYSFSLGEADQLVTCFSNSGNLVKFVAKGSRKIKSRFSAAVQLINLGEYVIYCGKGLPYLRQAEIIESFPTIRRDWTKSGAVLSVLELCRLLIAEEARETQAFRLVLSYIYHLKDNDYSSIGFDAFRLQFVNSLGYGMSFSSCVACGRAVDNGSVSWAEGGIVCSECRSESSNYINLRTDQLSILSSLQDSDFYEKGSCSQSQLCVEVVDNLIFWLTEGKTKTQAFRKLFEDGQ